MLESPTSYIIKEKKKKKKGKYGGSLIRLNNLNSIGREMHRIMNLPYQQT